jgi:aerobic C4-dicarboxylate transport protein
MERMHRHLNQETDAEADNPEDVLVAEEEEADAARAASRRAAE